MNILIIVHCLTGGGAERVAASWANSLHVRGHNVGVLSDFSKPVTYELNDGIVRFQKPNIKNRYIRKLFGFWSFYKTTCKAIDAIDADFVISVLHYRSVAVRLASKLSKSNTRHIMTEHNSFERPADAPMKFTTKWRKFYLNKIFDYITVLTHRDEEIMRERGFKNVSTLHNPLFLEPSREITGKEKNILAVGRMDIWHIKGFDVLIKAWNKIADRHSDWKLKIKGNGTPEIKKMLTGMGTSQNKVEFLPYTDRIAEEYRKAEIFVLSSRYEGWGLVLVEAMSQGCACVACDYLGRQAEIITDGENGLLCPPGDADMLADKIEQLINDAELRKRLQTKATKSLGSFSEDNIARQWESIFAKIRNY